MGIPIIGWNVGGTGEIVRALLLDGAVTPLKNNSPLSISITVKPNNPFESKKFDLPSMLEYATHCHLEAKKMISIITATSNSESQINGLISSLQNQTSKDFEWIIIDNKSNDKTLEIIRDSNVSCRIFSEIDRGIYDAINKGIKKSIGKYYMVIGADDKIFNNCIELAIKSTSSSPDFITWNILHGEKIYRPKFGKIKSHGARALFASHSAGMLIKKSVHDSIGLYNLNYRFCADQDFIIKSFFKGAIFIHIDKLLGEFTPGGVSTDKNNTLRVSIEEFLICNEYSASLSSKIRIIKRIFK